MTTGEAATSKRTKTGCISPEPVATPPYTEWAAAAFQTYYGSGGTSPYFSSTSPFAPPTVASGPQPHPYMWGGQHLMSPFSPYGTLPPPHAGMYPYGGIYAHHSMPPKGSPFVTPGLMSASAVEVPTTTSRDTEAMFSEGKARNTVKRSKASSETMTVKRLEATNGASESADGHAPSGDSRSEGNEEDTQQNGTQKGGSGQLTTVNGSNPSNKMAKLATIPSANLHTDLDFWNEAQRNSNNCGPNISPSSNTQALISAQNGVATELCPQDERELKRQKRKQSNRESARRSRLRKQAECEELSKRVNALSTENTALRSELSKMADDFERISSKKKMLEEKLQLLQQK